MIIVYLVYYRLLHNNETNHFCQKSSEDLAFTDRRLVYKWFENTHGVVL